MPDIPPLKVFKAKCPEIPILKNYDFGAPRSFWNKFPVNKNIKKPGPFKLDAEQILSRATKCGVQNMRVVRGFVNDIKNGCNLKVDNDAYKPRKSNNAPSARDEGEKVSDALATWIKKGIVCGPFEEHEVPKNATINGLMTKTKPTGAVRIIVNQSSPKGVSINDNISKDSYPCQMGGTKEWLKAINSCGIGSKMIKIDWNEGRIWKIFNSYFFTN